MEFWKVKRQFLSQIEHLAQCRQCFGEIRSLVGVVDVVAFMQSFVFRLVTFSFKCFPSWSTSRQSYNKKRIKVRLVTNNSQREYDPNKLPRRKKESRYP